MVIVKESIAVATVKRYSSQKLISTYIYVLQFSIHIQCKNVTMLSLRRPPDTDLDDVEVLVAVHELRRGDDLDVGLVDRLAVAVQAAAPATHAQTLPEQRRRRRNFGRGI